VVEPPQRDRVPAVPPGPGRWHEWTALDGRVWKLAFARAVNTMGLSLAMTFLGIYIVETRGYPAWLFGVVAMAANGCQSLANAWAGNLSDRIGRRPLITGSLFIRSAFIAALGAQVLFDAPLWSLAVNMVISSALRGCFEPVAYALVSDVVADRQRISAFGLQRMGTNLGWAIGPAIGGVLTLVIPYGTVFFIAAGAMIVAAIVTLTVADPIVRGAHKDTTHVLASLGDALREPTLRLLMLGTFLAAVLATQMYATFSIYMVDEVRLTKADVGLLYTLNGIGVLVLQLPALALVRRFGVRAVLPWASLGSATGFALVGFATGMPGGVLAILIITSAEVMFAPAHQTAIAEIADPAHRGRTYGVVGFAQTIGVAAAPLAGGVLLDTIGELHHVAMWLVIGCIGIAQAICFAAFARRVSSR
jgi:MFS family permease